MTYPLNWFPGPTASPPRESSVLIAEPAAARRQPNDPPPLPGIAGWIRGVLPEMPSRFFDHRRLMSLKRHLNAFLPSAAMQLFRAGRGVGFVAQNIRGNRAHEAMSRLYVALHSYRPSKNRSFSHAIAGWSFESPERSGELVELGRQLIDHCDEYAGYFYLNGRIMRPARYGDVE